MNEKIKKAAIAVFNTYPNAKVVFITTDEQAFLHEDRARMHDKDYTTVKRSEVMAGKPAEETKDNAGKTAATGKTAQTGKTAATAKPTVEELLKTISETTDVKALEALKKGEKRASVNDAIEAKIVELNKASK